MKKVIMIAIIILTISLLSCNSVEPEELKPGRRDYVWTVDTLIGLNNPRYRMWGSSSLDVWAVTSSNWENSISHFNGVEWSSYEVLGLFNTHAIYGFASNNVFVGADQGTVWRFDGNSWKKFAELTKDGRNDIAFNNIWGEFENNFYAFGGYPDDSGLRNNSLIAHYINGKWIMQNTDEIKGLVSHLYRNIIDSKIYVQTFRLGNGKYSDSTLIYEYSNGKYIQLYSSVWTQGLQSDISLINREVYFVLGNEIAIRRNDKFQTVLNVGTTNFYQRIWGRNSKDIFLLMTDGLAHYNGSNIEYLFYFNTTPRTQIYGAALFEDTAFFLVDEAQTGLSLIYHGKLNKEE